MTRFIALTIALVEVLVTYLIGGGEAAAKLTFYLLLPIFLIFWPRDMGSYTGHFVTRYHFDYPTPAWLVSFGGWLLLLLPIGRFIYWYAIT